MESMYSDSDGEEANSDNDFEGGGHMMVESQNAADFFLELEEENKVQTFLKLGILGIKLLYPFCCAVPPTHTFLPAYKAAFETHGILHCATKRSYNSFSWLVVLCD